MSHVSPNGYTFPTEPLLFKWVNIGQATLILFIVTQIQCLGIQKY